MVKTKSKMTNNEADNPGRQATVNNHFDDPEWPAKAFRAVFSECCILPLMVG